MPTGKGLFASLRVTGAHDNYFAIILCIHVKIQGEETALPEITAVTFDLWQTLLIDDRELGLRRGEARLESVRRILADCGERFDAERISQAYWDCYRQCVAIREALLDVSFDEQVGIFVRNIGPGLDKRLQPDTLGRNRPCLRRLIPGLRTPGT